MHCIANPPGIKTRPGSWEMARALISQVIEINYEGISGLWTLISIEI